MPSTHCNSCHSPTDKNLPPSQTTAVSRVIQGQLTVGSQSTDNAATLRKTEVWFQGDSDGAMYSIAFAWKQTSVCLCIAISDGGMRAQP